MAGANYYLPQLNVEQRKIKTIELCALGTETLGAFSVTDECNIADGLSDPRLGSMSYGVICETCKQAYPWCPGHWGHIELVEPMFNYCYFKVVQSILSTICKNCGMSLIDTTKPEYPDAARKGAMRFRLRALTKVCKGKCSTEAKQSEDTGDVLPTGGCGTMQPVVRRLNGTLAFEYRWPKGDGVETVPIYAKDILRLFEKVDPAHWEFLGFLPTAHRDLTDIRHKGCHPSDLILRRFPVPPLHVRPSVSFGGDAASEDDLTQILSQIIRYNRDLKAKIESNLSNEITEAREQLQLHIACLCNNTSTLFNKQKAKSRQGRAFKSIGERLKGKYGRLRQHLMGKRVDFCARTVITGDPNVEVDQVGVPRSVAMTLTFPERVTYYNKERLTKMVRNGSMQYPGANYIIQENGERIPLKMRRDRTNIHLNVGAIVERHMLDNDVVLFNRQPTLHRMSMMGHRARILPFCTFRLNLSVTTPYNADFDGDEMNLHLTQSLLTKSELIEMMMVPKNFINPGKGFPVMGIVQDSLAGVYQLTKRDTFLDKYMFQNMMMWVEGWNRLPTPAILKPKQLWTGKQAFTMACPEVSIQFLENNGKDKETMDEVCQNALMAPKDISVVVRKGELIHGTINKRVVGNSLGSLIHVIVNVKGADACKAFMNHVQRITAFFLLHHSFSVGIQDSVPTEASVLEVKKEIEKTLNDVRKVCQSASDGSLGDRRGKSLMEAFEAQVNTKLSDLRNVVGGAVVNGYKRNNGFKVMYTCGSKGNEMNISQIAAMVGQQCVEGARVKFGFRRRTLPHFVRDDYGDQSKGYIQNSYIMGLTPSDFFFHAMAGREGLIDTACKTADTGYIQRRIIKMCEDLHVAYDGTVRNASNQVFQFVYGEDGLDGPKVENQPIPFFLWDNNKTEKEMKYEIDDDGTVQQAKFGGNYMAQDVKAYFRENPSEYKVLVDEFDDFVKDRSYVRDLFRREKRDMFRIAVHYPRLIELAQQTFCSPGQQSDLNPVDIIDKVDRMLKDIVTYMPTRCRSQNNNFTKLRIECSLRMFHFVTKGYLNSKRVLREHKLNKNALDWLLGEIRNRFRSALVNPGEMVGAIAAQSCGEPATQMTLNTFHSAGVASKNVTLGVPRLKELLNVTQNPKVTNMTIYLQHQYSRTNQLANDEARIHIEQKSVFDIVKSLEVHFDPDPVRTVVAEDEEVVSFQWGEEFSLMDDDALKIRKQRVQENGSSFVARLMLDPAELNEMKIDPEYISTLIQKTTSAWFIEHSDGNCEQPRLRMRFADVSDERKELMKSIEAGEPYSVEDPAEAYRDKVLRVLKNVRLRGVTGISKSFLTERKKFYMLNPATGGYDEYIEWFVETEGSNLLQVLGLPFVDCRRTITNNITEIFQVLGIEAVMQMMCKEMLAVYEKYDVYVNYRHFYVLAEIMTFRGHLTSLTRQGISKTDSGPLMRATYEQQMEVLMTAAAFGEEDNTRGVSANIMLGQQIKGGTGMFELHLDHASVKGATPQQEAVKARGVDKVYFQNSRMSTLQSEIIRQTPFLNNEHVAGGGLRSVGSQGIASAAIQNVFNRDANVSPAMSLAANLIPMTPMSPFMHSNQGDSGGYVDAPHSVASSIANSIISRAPSTAARSDVSAQSIPIIDDNTNLVVGARRTAVRLPGLASAGFVPRLTESQDRMMSRPYSVPMDSQVPYSNTIGVPRSPMTAQHLPTGVFVAPPPLSQRLHSQVPLSQLPQSPLLHSPMSGVVGPQGGVGSRAPYVPGVSTPQSPMFLGMGQQQPQSPLIPHSGFAVPPPVQSPKFPPPPSSSTGAPTQNYDPTNPFQQPPR